jgi:hypothetical protein
MCVTCMYTGLDSYRSKCVINYVNECVTCCAMWLCFDLENGNDAVLGHCFALKG